MPRGKSKLAQIVDRLRAHYGPQSPPPARSAFELILWEKVAYLADDEKRAAAFQALRKRIGLTPKAILAADPSELREIAALGGAEKMLLSRARINVCRSIRTQRC